MSEVTNNTARSRYEISVDGAVAGYSQYVMKDGAVVFTHTEIDMDYEGQGLGSKLVRGMLADVRERGLKMVPQCPFVKEYVKKHPEYADLRA
ncbi:GNAT family N-acetyltransferase [Actinocorallia longicatena]